MNTVSEHSQRRPAGHSPRHGHAKPDPHIIVLFGATGDLSKRKLLPGLHHLFRAGLLPEEFRIIGSAPPDFAVSDEEFRNIAHAACQQFGNCKPDDSWDWMLDKDKKIGYVRITSFIQSTTEDLKRALTEDPTLEGARALIDAIERGA